MKQITFRQLQTRLPRLNELPVQITRYEKVIEILVPAYQLEDVTAKVKVLQQHSENVVEDPDSRLGKCANPRCKAFRELARDQFLAFHEVLGEMKKIDDLVCKKCMTESESYYD